MPYMKAILADLDDDAPRLVWADQIGGERGELVVIQCRLAGQLSDDDRASLEAREEELLDPISAWVVALNPTPGTLKEKPGAVELAGLAHSFDFERGFVEHVHTSASIV